MRLMSPGMPLESVHIVLTYRCTYECSHCFLHCGPGQPGAMTLAELKGLLEQAAAIDGVDRVYFEGGEPMLYYPLVQLGVERASELGLDSGMVTCGYYATTVPDGEMWLRPLKAAGLSSMEVSIDRLHGEGEANANARNLADAGSILGLDVSVISVCDPREEECSQEPTQRTGEEATPAMLRGRAAHEMVDGLEVRHVSTFTECPFEELEAPTRLHVDPYGNIHICQGILAGNVWDSSLAQIVQGYDPHEHPVLGPLIEGGPLALANHTGIGEGSHFASECHACYEIRRVLREDPEYSRVLGPNQVYGEEPEPPPTSYH
ncbi:MAG: radical SAM protein [Thermoplasmata archaeon]|nr:radical SAM protein [Thermoplasmata archaeon]